MHNTTAMDRSATPRLRVIDNPKRCPTGACLVLGAGALDLPGSARARSSLPVAVEVQVPVLFMFIVERMPTKENLTHPSAPRNMHNMHGARPNVHGAPPVGVPVAVALAEVVAHEIGIDCGRVPVTLAKKQRALLSNRGGEEDGVDRLYQPTQQGTTQH